MSEAVASTEAMSPMEAVRRAADAVNAEASFAFRIDALAVQRDGDRTSERPLGVGAVLTLRSRCSACELSWIDLLRDRKAIFRRLAQAVPEIEVCDFETLIEQRIAYAVVYGEDPSAVARA